MAKNIGNAFMKILINSPLGGLMGKGMAVVTVKGRKTGKLISTPINVLKLDETYTVISSRDRTWWRNLRGGAEATLRVSGKTCSVEGQVFESTEDVKTGMLQFLQQQPVMAKYLKIHVNDDGSLNENDLDRVVNERVLIKFTNHNKG